MTEQPVGTKVQAAIGPVKPICLHKGPSFSGLEQADAALKVTDSQYGPALLEFCRQLDRISQNPPVRGGVQFSKIHF